MELLDRYLQAVKKHLPFKRQDDIIAELKANMESQLEDKEAELGRPLTQGEQEDWLRKMGSPMMVAARYQPQQYLIGPAIFPIYWYVLRLALLWATVIYTIVSAVGLATSMPTGTAVFDALFRIPGVLVMVIAWVTAAFAAIEFVATHCPEKLPPMPGLDGKWNPSTLPPLEKRPAPGGKPRSYSKAVAEIVFGFLFLGWFVLVPQNPYLMFGPGAAYLAASPFQLTPVWMTFFWCVVALNLVQLLWRCIDFWRGTWQQAGLAKQIIFKILGLIPIVILLAVGDHMLIALKHPELDQVHYGEALSKINLATHGGLTVVCIIVTLTLTWDIFQVFFNEYRKNAAAK